VKRILLIAAALLLASLSFWANSNPMARAGSVTNATPRPAAEGSKRWAGLQGSSTNNHDRSREALNSAATSRSATKPADSFQDEIVLTTFLTPEMMEMLQAILWPDAPLSAEGDLQIDQIDSDVASENVMVLQSFAQTARPPAAGQLDTFATLTMAEPPAVWKMALIGLGAAALLVWRCRH